MKKRIIGTMLIILMLLNGIMPNTVCISVHAFTNYDVEVIKDKAPIREGYYEKKAVKKWVTKGTVLTVVGEKRNLVLNLWYEVKGGGYIYSENVKPVHKHNYKLVGYEKAHPHLSSYACSCGEGYCGNETQKQKGCKECYPDTNTNSKPTLTPSYTPKTNTILDDQTRSFTEEITKSNTNNTNSKPSNNSGSSSKSSNNSQNSNKNTQSTHKHEDVIVGYEKAHPHYAIHECYCGNYGYCGPETKKQDGCEKCYPHKHEDVIVGYEKAHPHYAIHECYCGNYGYCGPETKKQKGCSKCYSHEHVYKATSMRQKEHPHYLIEECSCGETRVNRNDEGYYSECRICKSPFQMQTSKYADFAGRALDLATGTYYPLPTVDSDGKDITHVTLDLLGLIPVWGAIFDGINVGMYLVEDDYAGAILSGMAFVPLVGYISTGGKYYKASGTLLVDLAADNVDDMVKVVSKYSDDVAEGVGKVASKYSDDVGKAAKNVITYTKPESVSEVAVYILTHSDDYSEETLRIIKKIADNKNIWVEEAFDGIETLVSNKYKGNIVTRAGLVYGYGSKEGNRLYHIVERHSYSFGKAQNVFKYDGKDIFYLIDDIVLNEDIAKTVVQSSRVANYYNTPYVIGRDGETILKVITEGDNVISAYPVFTLND